MARRRARNLFVGSVDVKNAFHQMRIRRWRQAYFALPAVLASDLDTRGNDRQKKRLVPASLIYPVTATLPIVSSRVMFFCLDAVTTPQIRCLVANLTWHLSASVGRMPTFYAFWLAARGADCTGVHLTRLIAGVKKAGLDVHHI